MWTAMSRAVPAPKPLAWFAVTLTPSGELEVDKDNEVQPGTYLSV